MKRDTPDILKKQRKLEEASSRKGPWSLDLSPKLVSKYLWEDIFIHSYIYSFFRVILQAQHVSSTVIDSVDDAKLKKSSASALRESIILSRRLKYK